MNDEAQINEQARAHLERLRDFTPRDAWQEWYAAMPAATDQRAFAAWWDQQPVIDSPAVRAPEPPPVIALCLRQ